MRYTPGSETDEATHRAYHEEYTNSLIPFKVIVDCTGLHQQPVQRVAVHDRVLGVNEDKGEKYIQLESSSGSRRNTKRVNLVHRSFFTDLKCRSKNCTLESKMFVNLQS